MFGSEISEIPLANQWKRKQERLFAHCSHCARVRVRGCTRVPSSGWLGEPMKGNEKPVAGRSHDGF